MPGIKHSLSKAERLRTRRSFLEVQGKGLRVHTHHFIWAYATIDVVAGEGCGDESPAIRIGLTVSRRVGNAVTRNRVKRLLRETLRHHKAHLPQGIALVVIAKSSAASLSGTEVKAEFHKALNQLRRRSLNTAVGYQSRHNWPDD